MHRSEDTDIAVTRYESDKYADPHTGKGSYGTSLQSRSDSIEMPLPASSSHYGLLSYRRRRHSPVASTETSRFAVPAWRSRPESRPGQRRSTGVILLLSTRSTRQTAMLPIPGTHTAVAPGRGPPISSLGSFICPAFAVSRSTSSRPAILLRALLHPSVDQNRPGRQDHRLQHLARTIAA